MGLVATPGRVMIEAVEARAIVHTIKETAMAKK